MSRRALIVTDVVLACLFVAAGVTDLVLQGPMSLAAGITALAIGAACAVTAGLFVAAVAGAGSISAAARPEAHPT